jgi:hypothetical protein
MMGGIIVGTLLTLLFLPALYVAWFRVPPPVEAKTKRAAISAAPTAGLPPGIAFQEKKAQQGASPGLVCCSAQAMKAVEEKGQPSLDSVVPCSM